MRTPAYVAVVGAGDATPEEEAAAQEVGRLLADAGAVVVCGGLGGVMAAACRGAKSVGGTTVGILPGDDRRDANQWVDVAVTTGMGETRNALIVRAVDVVVAVAGGYGTLSEIALGLRLSRPVVTLGSWEIDGVVRAAGPADAVGKAIDALSRPPGGTP
jgi:uncharacterized protein (TIGR00725 family)